MDPEIEDEHESHGEEPVPEDLSENGSGNGSIEEEEEDGIDWDMWWQIIVHRNAGVQEAEMPEYPIEAWTLDTKNPPFPFNLEATWYCATLLAIILAVHCEIDTTWLLRNGYSHYILRILSKTLLTVAISFASTLLFEVFGNVADLMRESYIDGIIIAINSWFIERFHWGPVDEHGNAGWHGDIQFDHDPTHIRQPIRATVINAVLVAFDYLFLIFSRLIPATFGIWAVWLASLVSTDLANFLFNISTYLALPTPGIDGTTDIKTLLWEYGPPVYLQLWAAALIYLFVFVFMSRAETPLILYQTGLDPFSKLAFNLLRATAVHLLAYTVYQIVYFCVSVTPPIWLAKERFYFLDRDPVLKKFNTRFKMGIYPGYGILITGVHWIVRNICRVLVRRLFPLWIPYIVWLSIKTEIATRHNWVVYEPLLNGDMDVRETGNRVFERALMTAFFGLKSSWPVRMRLTSNRDID
ncbi:hypothetical protein F4805DRAFT_474904 [Annulohypoxylon moriforme]|nr:hypothetical protein F4805DRAFT_474904 [Annulohypoxylon moriforme]